MKLNKKNLERKMAEKMLTTETLAKRSGISSTTISRLRNDKQKPKPITIGRLAKALEVRPEEIIENE